MNTSPMELEQGLKPLTELAEGEYGQPFWALFSGADEYLTFSRVGRLMCVWLKQPFAQPFPYDRALPSNWAKSLRYWEISGPVPTTAIDQNRLQADLLNLIAEEWHRPVEYLGEYNIFHSLCRWLRPAFCGTSEVMQQTEGAAKELREQGHDVALWSRAQLLNTVTYGVQSYLLQSVPALSPEHLPIIAGFTLLAIIFGQNTLCRFLADFEASYDQSKDRFTERTFPRCGSTHTQTSQPCKNKVRQEGMHCWIHANYT